MDPNTFPTKGNLILAKNSLALSRQGYELMDKKRNILIRELMELIDQAKDIQSQIDVTFRTAYEALQKANMVLGINFIQQISFTVPVEDSIRVKTRSVMGTEIPLVEASPTRIIISPSSLVVAAQLTGTHRIIARRTAASCINLFLMIGSISLNLLIRSIDTHPET